MSGGGASGEVAFPAYIEEFHHELLNDAAGTSVLDTNVEDVINAAVAAMANPYEEFGGWTNPASEYGVAENRITDLDAVIALLDAETNYTGKLTALRTVIDGGTVVNDLLLDYLATSRSEADSEVASAVAAIDIGSLAEITDWEAQVDAAVAKLDTLGVLNDIDVAALLTGSNGDAGTVMTSAIAQIGNTSIDENTEWEAFIDTVVAKLCVASNLADIYFPTVVEHACAGAEEYVQKIFTQASQFIDDGVLSALVTSFETRQAIPRANAVRRFTSQMADINAVNSSAFLFGMALIEAENVGVTGEYQAQLDLTLFREGVQAYNQQLVSALSNSTQVAQTNRNGYIAVLNQGLGNLVEMQVNRNRFEQAMVQLHAQIENLHHSNRLQAAATDKASRDGLIQAGVEAMVRMLINRVEYQKAFLELHRGAFLAHLEAQLRARTINKSSEDNILLQAVLAMGRDDINHLNLEQSQAQLGVEYARLVTVATDEYDGANLDLDVQTALWDMEILRRGAMVLAAPAGMAAAVPLRPSRVSSALGGALGGAATGAAVGSVVPGIGTAIGALAGGVLGGVAGLLR